MWVILPFSNHAHNSPSNLDRRCFEQQTWYWLESFRAFGFGFTTLFERVTGSLNLTQIYVYLITRSNVVGTTFLVPCAAVSLICICKVISLYPMFPKKKQKKKNAPVSTHTHPHYCVYTHVLCVHYCCVRTVVFYFLFEKKAVENMIIRNHKSQTWRVGIEPTTFRQNGCGRNHWVNWHNR